MIYKQKEIVTMPGFNGTDAPLTVMQTNPLDLKLAEHCDNGTVEQYDSEIFKKLLTVEQIKMNAGGTN